MERKIGETFDFEGKTLQVKESERGCCDGCFFDGKCYSLRQEVAGHCEAVNRGDNKEVIFVEVREQPQGLNLCEILKYCPEGEPLWSPMLNSVKFSDIDYERQMIIVETVEGHFTWEINHDGTISIDEVTSPEVMLYPSRKQRDWTKVKYEKKKKKPKTWKKFCENYPRKKDEAYFDMGSQICIFPQDYEYRTEDSDSKQAAEAHLALMQLHQLRDAWREGWLPEPNKTRWGITKDGHGDIELNSFDTVSVFLSFQDEERAELFVKHFRNIIMAAGDLI